MAKLNISNKWSMKVNGKPTACYVIKEFEKDIIAGRTDTKSIERYWEKRILPLMDGKALEEYTREDIDSILRNIQDNPNIRSERKGEDEKYSPSTVKMMEGLIRHLYRVAENNSVCEDIYWIPNFKNGSNKGTRDGKKRRLPKSLTPKMEERIINEVFNVKQNGETFGIALMVSTGLRNSEAASQVFGNIIRINGRYYLSSHTSMDPEKTIVRLGGKTYNMFRLIPLRKKILKLLLKRKAYLQEKIDNGEISFENANGISSIDQMPIACRGTDYFTHCSSRDLTREGRRILHKVEFDPDVYHEVMEEAESSHDILLFGEEKDGTAYLFRRCEGEHLKDAGCTDSEIQYYLGHVIIEENYNRSDFTNPEMLEALYQKAIQRPLLNDLETKEHIINSGKKFILENVTSTKIQFPFNGKRYRITLIPEEFQEDVQVTFHPKQKRTALMEIMIECKKETRPVTKAEKQIIISEANVTYDYKKRFDQKYIQDHITVAK